jgi:glycolate oxidase
VTRAWVKLTKLPQSANTMLAIFDDFDEGAQAVSDVIAAGIIPAALEMLDDVFLPCIEQAYKFGFPLDAAAILLIETDGLKEGAAAEAERAAQICKDAGAREVRWPKTTKNASCCGRAQGCLRRDWPHHAQLRNARRRGATLSDRADSQ